MKKTESKKPTPQRTIDQLSFARLIAQKLNLKLVDVMTVIEEEQKLTMEYVRLVVKKNYLTLESRSYQGKENWKSPLDGKTYNLPTTTRVLVRVGDGFKTYISEKKMPEKLCRFVQKN